MRKSSRFWWLHGAILLSAVVGCKSSNCGCGSGSGYGGGVPPAGTPGLTGSAGATMYHQGASPSYSGMPVTSSSMPSSMSSSMTSGAASGMPAGQSYAPPASSSFSGQGLSSGGGGAGAPR